MTRRARDPQDKAARKQSILDAAWRLLDERAAQLPSVSQIAKEARLAKGTIYIYFETREEIYLALLETQFLAWLASIQQFISEASVNISQLAKQVCEFAADHRKFMRLAASSNAILEQNLSYEAAKAYKQTLAEGLVATGHALETHLDTVPEGKGIQLLIEGYTLVLGMWSFSEPPEIVRQVIKQEQMELFDVDFVCQASDALLRLWQGTLASHSRTQ